MTHLQEINARGNADGAASQALARRASDTGRTMASLFVESVRNASAYSIPALCVSAKRKLDRIPLQ